MGWSGGLGLLARCPSAVHSIPERIGVPGAAALEDRWGLQVLSRAGKYGGRWAGQLSGGSPGSHGRSRKGSIHRREGWR